jgi:hypothetical protein
MMNLTAPVSVWSTRHPSRAIAFIILMEITNVAIGITVGSALLKESSPWVLMGMLIAGIVLIKNLKRYANIRLVDLTSRARFMFQKHAFFGLFCLNILIYTAAGGMLGHMVAHPEGTTEVYGSLSSVSETVSSKSSSDSKRSFREKMRQQTLLRAAKPPAGDPIRRFAYFALFLLSFVLAYIGAVLSCSLLCSGYGVAAVLLLLITIGVLAGGFYFFGRGVAPQIKPYKDMTRDERRREGRRYLRTLAGTVLALGIFIVIAGLSS